MKNSFLIFFSVLFIISNFSIIAQKGNSGKLRSLKVIENLNLDDIQRDKIEDIYLKKEEDKIELQTELKKNRLEIKKMMVKDNLKNDELLELVDKGGKIRNDLIKSRVSFWLDVNEILNDDQKEIWKNHLNVILAGSKREFESSNRKFLKRKERLHRSGPRSGRF